MSTEMKKSAAPAGVDFPRPLTTVDVAIFSVIDDCLQVLLVARPDRPGEPFPGAWALPGGFIDVDRDADLEACALRKLREKTGVQSPYLEQLGSWGGARRDPRGWSSTHVYFALISADPVVLQKGANAADVAWHPVEGESVKVKLAFDHAKLLQAAVERLRGKVEYTSLPAYLVPAEFTLTELQRMYEIVLERPLEKSAFRTRVLAADFVEELPKMREGPNRPARLYRLKKGRELVYFPRTFNPPKI
jgi:ADP-ribose pyrophosphatase YjhB (NUDIX family)